MVDPELHNIFTAQVQRFTEGLTRAVVGVEHAMAAIEGFQFARSLADPPDIDDDPAFARFCDILRRW